MEGQKSEKNWLVKSSTRVMGPYSVQELLELIQKKNISLLDEARKPVGRWTYIRENKELAPLISKMKINDPNDRTVSQMTSGQTISKTENVIEINESKPDPVKFFKSQNAQELIKDIVPIKEETVTYNTAAKPSNLTYGAYTDSEMAQAVESKARPIKKILIALTGIIILSYVGYSLFSKSKQSQSYQTLVSTAMRLKSIQLYEKSYQVYKRAKAQRVPDLAIQAQMSLLSMVFDNDTNSSRKVIEKYLSVEDIKDRKELVDYYTAIAISYLREGDHRNASEYLQKAGGVDPFNQVVILNRSLLQLQKGEFRESYVNLKKVNSYEELLNLLTFVKAYTLIELSKAPSSFVSEIKEISMEIPNQIQKSALLRNELLLLNIKLYSTLKHEDSVLASINHFLDTYPRAAKNIVRDPRIDWKMTEWDALEKICAELSQGRAGYKIKLMKARCLMENQNYILAQKWIDEAVAEAPSDPYVINTQIQWLNLMNRDVEALALAKKNENRLNAATQAILVDICIENNDESCANVNLNKMSINTFMAPKAFYGMAQMAVQKNKKVEALQNIKQGLSIEPLFLPLLELRESLESQ